MFAMNETLSTNTAQALALIAAHPQAEARVRAEMARTDVSSTAGIDSLAYLEGCVQEAMRLWPTTPMLVRELVSADTLDGVSIPAKTQVLILNSFNHRDRDTHAFADTFSPEYWLDTRTDYHFNHLSNGPQVCAGKDLVLFLTKAVVVALLAEDRYVLRQPALHPGSSLPYRYNYFDLVLSRQPAGSTRKVRSQHE
jgi:cytochrome P450